MWLKNRSGNTSTVRVSPSPLERRRSDSVVTIGPEPVEVTAKVGASLLANPDFVVCEAPAGVAQAAAVVETAPVETAAAEEAAPAKPKRKSWLASSKKKKVE